MRAAFAIAALAGAAIAAPSYGTGYGQEEVVKHVVVVVETVTETCYVTEGYEVPSATPEAPKPAPAAPTTTVVYEAPTSSFVYVEPAKSTPVYEAPAPSSPVYEAPAYTPPPVVTPTPTPAPAPAPAPAPSAPAQSGYMAVVSEWRAKMGMSDLACDSKLESNAMDTVVASNGAMVHKLNPGTYGQVLAPDQGGAKSFEDVFVGGWLCEKPNLPGLDGVCSTMSQGWAYEGKTGHADILTSTSYSKIGCALHEGIWCCDLA